MNRRSVDGAQNSAKFVGFVEEAIGVVDDAVAVMDYISIVLNLNL